MRPLGISRQPNVRKATVTIESGRPAGVKSNSVNGLPCVSWRTAEISRFGDVPIWVMVPPTREPKASGIR